MLSYIFTKKVLNTHAPRNTQSNRAPSGGRLGGRIFWQHEAEHLSTLVTAASRPPPDPEASLKRLHQLADNKQLTVTPVRLILRDRKSKKELIVTNIENGVRNRSV